MAFGTAAFGVDSRGRPGPRRVRRRRGDETFFGAAGSPRRSSFSAAAAIEGKIAERALISVFQWKNAVGVDEASEQFGDVVDELRIGDAEFRHEGVSVSPAKSFRNG